VSQLVRIRTPSLALAVALLALLPAAARAGNGGASAATKGSAGGASVGTAAPVRPTSTNARRAGGASVRRVRRHHRARHVSAPRKPRTTAPAVAPATLLPDGTAIAPPGAPAAVAAVIAAGNRIASLPYRWGGGHARWEDTGYDCSGSVGYALHGGGLLDVSATSGELASYGQAGPGTWVTLYANDDHVYMVVAGLRFDTSGARPSRWQTESRLADGFAIRHPANL
jgi:cell wall-associated NlpC family hydrolase